MVDNTINCNNNDVNIFKNPYIFNKSSNVTKITEVLCYSEILKCDIVINYCIYNYCKKNIIAFRVFDRKNEYLNTTYIDDILIIFDNDIIIFFNELNEMSKDKLFNIAYDGYRYQIMYDYPIFKNRHKYFSFICEKYVFSYDYSTFHNKSLVNFLNEKNAQHAYYDVEINNNTQNNTTTDENIIVNVI